MRVVGKEFLPVHAQAAGEFRKVGSGARLEHNDRAELGILGIRRQRLEAEGGRVAHDLQDGEEARHIKAGLLPELEARVKLVVLLQDIGKVSGPGGLLGAANGTFAAIVGGYGQMPVVEDAVQVGQVLGGGMGGAVRIHALVHPPVLRKSIDLASGGYELPHARGMAARNSQRVIAAFEIGEVGKVFGQALGAEHGLSEFQVGLGVAQEMLHSDAPLAGILYEVVAHHGFHGRVEVAVEHADLIEHGLFGRLQLQAGHVHRAVGRARRHELRRAYALHRTARKYEERRYPEQGETAQKG